MPPPQAEILAGRLSRHSRRLSRPRARRPMGALPRAVRLRCLSRRHLHLRVIIRRRPFVTAAGAEGCEAGAYERYVAPGRRRSTIDYSSIQMARVGDDHSLYGWLRTTACVGAQGNGFFRGGHGRAPRRRTRVRLRPRRCWISDGLRSCRSSRYSVAEDGSFVREHAKRG